MATEAEKNASIRIYTQTYDDGAAPCHQDGITSLVICKGQIRKLAAVGDIVIGMGGSGMPGCDRGDILWVGRVSAKMSTKEYHPRYGGKRRDAIYTLVDGELRAKSLAEGNPYHLEQENWDKDTEEGTDALIFTHWRDMRRARTEAGDAFRIPGVDGGRPDRYFDKLNIPEVEKQAFRASLNEWLRPGWAPPGGVSDNGDVHYCGIVRRDKARERAENVQKLASGDYGPAMKALFDVKFINGHMSSRPSSPVTETDSGSDSGSDVAGVISFQLDGEKVFFGTGVKSSTKKISFIDKGLQIPVQDVWGDEKDADIVPYEQIERITYDVGKHLFLSVMLKPESPKQQTVLKTFPGMRRRKFSGEQLQRILLPLCSSQADTFTERRERIEDEFISVSHSDTFFVQAHAHQVQELLLQTPYQVGWTRCRCWPPLPLCTPYTMPVRNAGPALFEKYRRSTLPQEAVQEEG